MKTQTQETKHPKNIHCLALNYPGVSGTGLEEPPLYFIKASSCFGRSGGIVRAPDKPGKFWTECELGIVVAKDCSFVKSDEAYKYIKGFVVCGDMTFENINNYDHHLAYSKARYGFCPTSKKSRMLSVDDLSSVELKTYINEELKQIGKLCDAKLNVMESLAYVSSITKLESNDLILTGTPLGWENCMLKPGDRVRQVITGLDDLEYTIEGT